MNLNQYLETHKEFELAKLLGVTRQAVNYMKQNPERIGAIAACNLEVATRGKIRRVDLRPDLFGDLDYEPDPDTE